MSRTSKLTLLAILALCSIVAAPDARAEVVFLSSEHLVERDNFSSEPQTIASDFFSSFGDFDLDRPVHSLHLTGSISGPTQLNSIMFDASLENACCLAGNPSDGVRASSVIRFEVFGEAAPFRLHGILENGNTFEPVPTDGRTRAVLSLGETELLRREAGGRNPNDIHLGLSPVLLDETLLLEPGIYTLEISGFFIAGGGASGNTRANVTFTVPEPATVGVVLPACAWLASRRRGRA